MTASGRRPTAHRCVAADQAYKGAKCGFSQYKSRDTKPSLPRNSANFLV